MVENEHDSHPVYEVVGVAVGVLGVLAAGIGVPLINTGAQVNETAQLASVQYLPPNPSNATAMSIVNGQVGMGNTLLIVGWVCVALGVLAVIPWTKWLLNRRAERRELAEAVAGIAQAVTKRTHTASAKARIVVNEPSAPTRHRGEP